MFNLSPKEIIELRLKCLEPYVVVASKAGIEQDTVIKKAEEAWKYATKPLAEKQPESPENIQPPVTGPQP